MKQDAFLFGGSSQNLRTVRTISVVPTILLPRAEFLLFGTVRYTDLVYRLIESIRFILRLHISYSTLRTYGVYVRYFIHILLRCTVYYVWY